jgi:RNA polymerase sigma-70 factor, ECF subfamily
MAMEASSYVERAVTGGAHASGAATTLADLYDAHGAAVYRLALAILGSRADAQDAVSETFLAAARHDLRRIHNPRAYLLASVRHQAIAILRRRRRETTTDPADACLFDAQASPPDQTLLARRVADALRELPAEQREVIVLKVYEELTFAEIAKITHTRPNTVASRYRYAVEKLRKLLGED